MAKGWLFLGRNKQSKTEAVNVDNGALEVKTVGNIALYRAGLGAYVKNQHSVHRLGIGALWSDIGTPLSGSEHQLLVQHERYGIVNTIVFMTNTKNCGVRVKMDDTGFFADYVRPDFVYPHLGNQEGKVGNLELRLYDETNNRYIMIWENLGAFGELFEVEVRNYSSSAAKAYLWTHYKLGVI